MKRTFFAMALALPLVGCTSAEAPITGSWVEPLTLGGNNSVQGFKLNEDGTASSINMSTLVWKSWARSGNDLIMTGESIGNGASFEFSDTMRIDKLNRDSLLLIGRGGNVMGFGRQK